MTVKELRKLLKNFDSDMDVAVSYLSCGICQEPTLTVKDLIKDPHSERAEYTPAIVGYRSKQVLIIS